MARAGKPAPIDFTRLTGGAMMESWLFSCGEEKFVLRRAPSPEFMEGRAFGHTTEAAIIRAAYAAGVTAPEVVAQLQPDDGIGSGYVMRALPGTADPKIILDCDRPDRLLNQCAAQLARIHAIDREGLPAGIVRMDYREALAGLRDQFREAGADRPVIALALRWLGENCPEPVDPVLNHGDFRLGNLLVEDGRLTGVLDWELAHWGDPHEDLAFACMTVWRFNRPDREALGLGSFEDWFAAYEANGGQAVDRGRFRYWLVYRTVWWALGCLQMAKYWRSGEDRMLERVVISRRTSEQELDLLLLLETDAPADEAARMIGAPAPPDPECGEANIGELAEAVSEWLATIKSQVEGHDRFQLAVARNALGIIGRDQRGKDRSSFDPALSADIMAGAQTLASPGLLTRLRTDALRKLSADMPKYPALALARAKWTGEN